MGKVGIVKGVLVGLTAMMYETRDSVTIVVVIYHCGLE